MIRKGEVVTVEVNYPKNKKLCGVWSGRVIETGCFRSGFAFFKLEGAKYAFPNSSKYTKILHKRR